MRRMTSTERALLAILALDAGDPDAAERHLSVAQRETRTTARRDRQVVEIAALVVRGDRTRAAGLALEHAVEFPADGPLLEQLHGADAKGAAGGAGSSLQVDLA